MIDKGWMLNWDFLVYFVWNHCKANLMKLVAKCIVCTTDVIYHQLKRILTQAPQCMLTYLYFWFHNYIYLPPTTGQLTVQWGLWWNVLLSVLTYEHGGGKAVRPRWASNRQIKRITLWWSSALHTSMTSWFLEEEGHVNHVAVLTSFTMPLWEVENLWLSTSDLGFRGDIWQRG